jgi:DNA-binding response OmpR family regulator
MVQRLECCTGETDNERGKYEMTKRALIVEDDGNIAELLRLYLGKDGFEIMIATDGGKAESMFDLFSPDVVLLDIMLPVKDGWQVCKDIRKKSSVPIIMLTAKGETNDKVSGLEMGADDYVTKPFEVKELLARVHAVMRRTDADAPVEKKLSFDKLIVNLDSYELIVDGVKVDTPPKEMELLYHLAASPNRVFTRNQLLDEVWGFDYFGDSRTVDVHVKRLREKLEGVSDKWSLKTVWGVGYKFEVTE